MDVRDDGFHHEIGVSLCSSALGSSARVDGAALGEPTEGLVYRLPSRYLTTPHLRIWGSWVHWALSQQGPGNSGDKGRLLSWLQGARGLGSGQHTDKATLCSLQ